MAHLQRARLKLEAKQNSEEIMKPKKCEICGVMMFGPNPLCPDCDGDIEALTEPDFSCPPPEPGSGDEWEHPFGDEL